MNNLESTNTGDQIEQAAVAPSHDESTQVEQEKMVPLSALESERAKRQEREDENRTMRDHLALMQANQQQNQPKVKDDFDGLEDSDIMTVGEFKKLSGKLTNQFQMSIEELKMTQRYPDYQDVISKYLPEVLKTNPNLKSSLQKTQDYELAYYLAKNSDNYKSENKKAVRSADADRIIKNSQSSGSLSSMGASTPVMQAKRYKDMSDAEFKEQSARNLGY